MALDMSDGGGSTNWFGFSPVVVIVAAVVLLGGGWYIASSPEPSYAQALADVCEDHADWIEQRWGPGGEESNRGGSVDYANTVFHQVNRSAVARQAAFRALRPGAADSTDHAAILASEQRIVDLSAGAAAQVERARSARGAMGKLDEIFAENRMQGQRLTALGAKIRQPEPPTDPALAAAATGLGACAL